jgi:3-oxoacyl-[acyl-carrier-protein] synthase-3
MQQNPTARILSVESYLPSHILTNQDLEKLVETSDEWIVSRTGMHERRIAAPDECPSDMGFFAAVKAIESARITSEDIDLILVATMTPDFLSPSTACLIQSKIGATRAAAMDIQAACTGFLYGLSMAKAYVESGIYRTVLLIATEKMSAFIDYSDRSMCVLFGDGASAAVISNGGPGFKINDVRLGADGSLAELFMLPAGGSKHPATAETVAQGGHYYKMVGNEVFKHAVRRMTGSARDCLEAAGLEESQVSWLVPHQANKRIIDAMAKQFNIPDEKVYKTVHKYGNTSASSIGIALAELLQEHQFVEGERLLLTAFGGGLTWGASILSKVLT